MLLADQSVSNNTAENFMNEGSIVQETSDEGTM